MTSQLFHRFLIGTLTRSLVLSAAVAGLAASAHAADCPVPANKFHPDPSATSLFLTGRCKFATTGNNPFFILQLLSNVAPAHIAIRRNIKEFRLSQPPSKCGATTASTPRMPPIAPRPAPSQASHTGDVTTEADASSMAS